MFGLTKTSVSNRSIGSNAVKSDALRPLYGIVYKPNDNFSFYASHTESFGKGSLISGISTQGRFLVRLKQNRMS